MIRIEKTDVFGWDSAIRGMRNPMNSWDKSDSKWDGFGEADGYAVGDNDLSLMKKLVNAGNDHAKFLRMINVTADITAPLYWWKEFDTYKVGTVANSCSTMHKIHAKEFALDDFSHEHLIADRPVPCKTFSPLQALNVQIDILNKFREMFLEAGGGKGEVAAKEYWWQMIQLLPSSYNQKRTVQLNYAVLRNMYHSRKNHKLDEWHTFCAWVEKLPYAGDLIIGKES